MSALWQDARHAIRALTRHRGFAAASLATLALGIGATTAIFTVVNAVVFRPLPFPASHQLVQVSATPAERGEAIPLAELETVRALALATIGTYAVMSYVASARTREFAIRLAIGAPRRGVMGLILARTAGLTAVGLLVGYVVLRMAAPLVRDLPSDIGPPDMASTAPVALMIAAVTLAASFLPAYRAAATNLATTLRND